jgi:hypothetical protein
MSTDNERLTRPLARVTEIMGLGLAAILVLVVVTSLIGSGSIGGFGRGATSICATDPYLGISDSPDPRVEPYQAKPGYTLDTTFNLRACTGHPTMGQRLLETLTTVPTALLYGCILLLLWHIIRTAQRDGPFTLRVAATMRLLGWVVMAGAVAVAVIQQLALGMLINSMLTRAAESPGSAFGSALYALLPVPLLAGAALITFARIIRLGTSMDDELKATV